MSNAVGYEQTQRIWRLIALLRTPGGSLKTLAAGCEASIHTTRKDLQFLRSMWFKIQKTQVNAHVAAIYSLSGDIGCPVCSKDVDG